MSTETPPPPPPDPPATVQNPPAPPPREPGRTRRFFASPVRTGLVVFVATLLLVALPAAVSGFALGALVGGEARDDDRRCGREMRDEMRRWERGWQREFGDAPPRRFHRFQVPAPPGTTETPAPSPSAP